MTTRAKGPEQIDGRLCESVSLGSYRKNTFTRFVRAILIHGG